MDNSFVNIIILPMLNYNQLFSVVISIFGYFMLFLAIVNYFNFNY
jgi:hypothetical protein